MTTPKEVTCAECGQILPFDIAQKKWKQELGRWICDLCVDQAKKVGGNLLKKVGRAIWRWIKRRRR